MFALYCPSLVRFNFASEVKFLGQRALQNSPSRKSKLSQVLRHHGSHIDHYSLSRPTCSCVHLKTFYKKSWIRRPEGCLLLLSQVLRHRGSHIDHKRDASGMQLALAHSVKTINVSLKMYVTFLFVRFEESCQRIKFNGLSLT